MSDATYELRPAAPRWTHVALRVRDVEASIAWYTEFTTLEVLAHSPLVCKGKASFADMTYYTAPSGAGVPFPSSVHPCEIVWPEKQNARKSS